MEVKSYRNFTTDNKAIPEIPLEEYKQLAKRIELHCLHAKRLFGRATSPNTEIDKLTQDWSTGERERFRYWFRNTRNPKDITAEKKMQTREAQYAPMQSQEQISQFKDKRRSIVRRLRRLQSEIEDLYSQTSKGSVEWADDRFPTREKKIEAISNAINQICVLLNTLRTHEVAAAAIVRTVKALNNIDPEVANKFTNALNEFGGTTRVAAQGPTYQVAKALKQELNDLHYGKHLRRFFHMYEALHRLGLAGIASDLEAIIQKDLSDLSNITKKLSEVYSELLKIPGEELVEAKEEEAEVKPIGEEDFRTPQIERTNIPAQ